MQAVAARAPLEFLLNGRAVCVPNPLISTTLLDFLRAQGLTGAKEGCAEGECGACTVVFVSPQDEGSAYRAVNSCLLLLPMIAGQEVYTVEALATGGELTEAQRAMAAAGGSQCGYCTPGFVMSLFAEQYRRDRVGACDPHQLAGNLCRCTGYRPIRDAALELGPPPAGAFLDRLSRPAPTLEPVEFRDTEACFSRPVTLSECLSILASDPEARPIAGATDMGVDFNLRGSRWRHLVSLEAISELREFSETGDRIRIGAALPLSEIAARWPGAPEAFHQWLPLFASSTLRNRATLGGNLATASPIGDGAPLLLALDARVHIASASGSRSIAVCDFFTGYRRTLLARGELLSAIEIPKPLPAFTRFYKVAKRRTDDISTVAAAMGIDRDADGRILRARFAFGGVAPLPMRAIPAEEAILGQRWNQAAVEHVQSVLARTVQPITDHRGSAEYRLAVAQSLVERFWWERRELTA